MRDPCTGVHRRIVRHIDRPGDAHALTFTCFRGHAFLRSDRAKGWLTASLARAAQLHSLHVWAWVIMPTHAHVLYLPTREGTRTRDVLVSFKLPVTKKAVSYVRRHAPGFLERMADTSQATGVTIHRLWQRGPGYDRNLRSASAIRTTIDYIHNNPVRAGYCERAADWPWSSARAYVAGVAEGSWLNTTRLPARPA